MGRKVIITGTTGMVGKGVLLECLESPHIASVLVINRHLLGIKHKKMKELILENFHDLSGIKDELRGFDACFFCLGISSVGLSEEKYATTTYHLTLHFAETLLELNPELTFCYVSGAGTDSKEKSRMMWARVKGKTENALLAMPFKAAYMFRPGLIQPMRGIKSRTKSYNIFYGMMKPFYPLLKILTKKITDTQRFGKAMIKVIISGYDKKILTNRDINRLAAEE